MFPSSTTKSFWGLSGQVFLWTKPCQRPKRQAQCNDGSIPIIASDDHRHHTVFILLSQWEVAKLTSGCEECLSQLYHGQTIQCKSFFASTNISLNSKEFSDVKPLDVYPLFLQKNLILKCKSKNSSKMGTKMDAITFLHIAWNSLGE